MRVQILRNAFEPNGSKAPTILKKGSAHELPDDQAKTLIDRGLAAEITAGSEEKESKKGKKGKKEAAEVSDVTE